MLLCLEQWKAVTGARYMHEKLRDKNNTLLFYYGLFVTCVYVCFL